MHCTMYVSLCEQANCGTSWFSVAFRLARASITAEARWRLRLFSIKATRELQKAEQATSLSRVLCRKSTATRGEATSEPGPVGATSGGQSAVRPTSPAWMLMKRLSVTMLPAHAPASLLLLDGGPIDHSVRRPSVLSVDRSSRPLAV